MPDEKEHSDEEKLDEMEETIKDLDVPEEETEGVKGGLAFKSVEE